MSLLFECLGLRRLWVISFPCLVLSTNRCWGLFLFCLILIAGVSSFGFYFPFAVSRRLLLSSTLYHFYSVYVPWLGAGAKVFSLIE